MNHSIAQFKHVHLSSSAILGPLKKSSLLHQHFLAVIWRISTQSQSPHCSCSPHCVQVLHAPHPDGGHLWIFSRTQQMPIFYVIAQA